MIDLHPDVLEMRLNHYSERESEHQETRDLAREMLRVSREKADARSQRAIFLKWLRSQCHHLVRHAERELEEMDLILAIESSECDDE